MMCSRKDDVDFYALPLLLASAKYIGVTYSLLENTRS
jgi:hypothetical protein